MPIYEYQCEGCDERTEAIQSFDDPPLAVCPHCGGPLQKLMSAPSFQFKGTGWYVTDYAGKGKGEKRGDEAGSGGGAKETGESKAAKAPAEAKSGDSASSSDD